MVDPVVRTVAGGSPVDARTLDDAAAARRGHGTLGGAVWRDLASPQPGSVGILAGPPEGPAEGYLHLAPSDSFAPQHWTAGVVVEPAVHRADDLLAALLARVRAEVAARGGGSVLVWWTDPDADDRRRLEASGFRPARAVLQLRVPLPLHEDARWPGGVRVRTFAPGRDEAAWLEVNNRAFRNHPDQGGWIEATLARRIAEPWFDPDLFLLAEDDDGLLGFDWCKVHPASGGEPALGEIFVIGVDPRAQGRGLGRALALEGLARLAARGITTGMLFVAESDLGARGLYEKLGFREHRRDQAFGAEIDPA